MAGLLDRFQYRMAQSARVAWYAGHYLALRRINGNRPRKHDERYKAPGELPPRDEMLRSMRELMEKDWRNIEQGIYAKPHDMGAPDFGKLARASLRFWRDAKKVDARRADRMLAAALVLPAVLPAAFPGIRMARSRNAVLEAFATHRCSAILRTADAAAVRPALDAAIAGGFKSAHDIR